MGYTEVEEMTLYQPPLLLDPKKYTNYSANVIVKGVSIATAAIDIMSCLKYLLFHSYTHV